MTPSDRGVSLFCFRRTLFIFESGAYDSLDNDFFTNDENEFVDKVYFFQAYIK